MYIGIGIDLQEPPEVRENALCLTGIHVLVETFIHLSAVEGHRVEACAIVYSQKTRQLLHYCAYLSHFKPYPSNCFTVRNSEI